MRASAISALACFVAFTAAQTFQRLGGCPDLGCIFPPDQVDFLAGQFFDIRLEVHSPVNGSEARIGEPDENFKFTIAKKGGKGNAPVSATEYFKIDEPELEKWDFSWFEDRFAQDAETPSLVNVTSKIYRRIALYEPGEYEVTLTYYGEQKTVANWFVRDLPTKRRAKNVVMFIGDGMTTNMITAARLIAHRSINGKYMTKMALDKFPVLGHQMTHSMDSFITDSANSATALYTGHKTTVNALGVYVDSSSDAFDDPKFETIAEIFRRKNKNAGVGIVSTAFLADATPAGLAAHTSDRGEYDHVIGSYYAGGLTDYEWTNWDGPDVLLGAGAEDFLESEETRDYYKLFAEKGYNVAWNNTALHSASNKEKLLGVFQKSNLATWLDRNVYQSNLYNQSNYPDGSGRDADDLPGLKDMTLKAIDVLDKRHRKDGWFLMSEAASIDKQMHTLDYDRSLGELLELDDTVRATIEKLEKLGQLEDTLIIVTADHGHGFDVTGSVDTKYMDAQEDDRSKRNAVGYYENSGLSQYTVAGSNALRYSEGVHFPAQWDPRYTLHSGVGAFPDHRENYRVHGEGPRTPAVKDTKHGYVANYKDAVSGFMVNGTIPVDAAQGVHSLTDVPVFARGPCQELFGGVYSSIDIFFNMAECLGLSETKGHGKPGKPGKPGH
ncbi:Alkaline phosphatase-like alpha/beta/alpha [Penicillium concentricum]|uniref:alkaline phosphatase n=1 Tax=Penicillium concentricum TaxID=293559 RepID=A0A9W9SBL1_9EURO|nr:Alkaline phosphatase-like alpha/beta/alpha [Penicillium concentricum]KAJ5375015.1 Alkaline phosphatase-like alpha/beta/alpha [Penicillium concentricum]